jgi:hypothetical protein
VIAANKDGRDWDRDFSGVVLVEGAQAKITPGHIHGIDIRFVSNRLTETAITKKER